jgi:hypothetical protein
VAAPLSRGPARPLRPQDAETIHRTERDQRRQELADLRRSNDGAVTRAAEQLGRQQVFTSIRPPEAESLVRDVPGMSAQERAQTLDAMKPEYRRWLAKDPAFVDALHGSLPPKEFARTAAQLMVDVDPRASQPATARLEARAQAERMLQDPDVAARLLKSGAGMVVVPKDVSMTDVNAFHHMRGTTAGGESGGGRGWDDVRGSGGRRAAVTEENLLGEHTTIGDAAHYEDGYSTTTHEFAHTVHQVGLAEGDRKTITDSYQQKVADPQAAWSDGPRHDTQGRPVDNYGSRDELEYFAQVSNAYLGTNHGTDPHTGQPRNNGPEWVRANEPHLVPLLERLYGPDPVAVHQDPANPVEATRADNDMYQGFREFMGHVDPQTPAAHESATHEPPTHEPATPHQDPPTTPHPDPTATPHDPATTPHDPAGAGHVPPPPAPHVEQAPGERAGGNERSGENHTPPPPEAGSVHPEPHRIPDGMSEHETVESEFRLGTAALLEQTVISRLSESGLGLPEGALVLGGGGGVAAVQLHRPVQDLDMRLTFDGNASGRSNEVLDFLAHEVLTEGSVVPGRRDTATTVTGKFGGLDVSITLAPVHPQEHRMHVVVNGETHTGETVPLKVVASEDLLGDKIAALAMRKQDAKVDVAMLREKRLRDATDVLTLYSKLEPGALDRLRTDRESLRPAIGKLADVVAEVSKHSGTRLTPEQKQTLDEISRGLGSEPTARPAKASKPKPTPEELAALKAQKEENKRLKAAAAAAAQAAPAPAPVPHQAGSSTSGADRGPVTEHTAPAPPPPPPAFRTGPVSRGINPAPPPPAHVATGGGSSHAQHNADVDMEAVSDHGSQGSEHADMEVEAPVRQQRTTLPVAVQTTVVGNPHRPLNGDEVFLSEVLPSNDRPMTRFGSEQRSHTVPWGLTRRAAGGFAGRSAESVWHEIKTEVGHMKAFPPEPKGAAARDFPMVQARWNDIVHRLDSLPDQPPVGRPLAEWHRNLGDLVSGYIEISQLTSFASFADGRAVGHGEAHLLDHLGRFERGEAPPPSTQQVVGTLLDIKATSSLSDRDAVAARVHLIRSLHRAYPQYMTEQRREDIREQLGLAEPVQVVAPGALPPGAPVFTRYGLRSDLVADLSFDPHTSTIGRIMLSEQARPDTQFGSTQNSHAASWSLMRASLLSFQGKSHQQLEGWLGERFQEMHGVRNDLDATTRAAVDHARAELGNLDQYPPHERAARTGDLVRVFVSAHQKLPHTTFVDTFQLGSATSSGELDLVHLGTDRHDATVASHFDGAAPFNMQGTALARSYHGWKSMAETLGPVGPDTVTRLAERTFSDKNLEQLAASANSNPMQPATAQRYLQGLAEWEGAVSTVFPDHGPAAVEATWARYRGMFTPDRFGGVKGPQDQQALNTWFNDIRAAPTPRQAAPALAALARFYEVRSGEGRRSDVTQALQQAVAAGTAVAQAQAQAQGAV